jgi:RNA polymerase sigma factor (sigma-70 family)
VRLKYEPAFEMLVKRYHARVFALALRYTRVHEDTEDVVQQTFLKVFVYLQDFEGRSSFGTWLMVNADCNPHIFPVESAVFRSG